MAYPANFDNISSSFNGTSPISGSHALHHDQLGDAINRMQSALGVNPQGAYVDLAARLDGMAPVAPAVWDNAFDSGQVAVGISQGTFFLFPLDPVGGRQDGNGTAERMFVDMVYSAASVSAAQSMTTRIGLYTRTGDTLSLVNSVEKVYTQAGATQNSSLLSGTRFVQINSSEWSSAPALSDGVQYYAGMVVFTTGGGTAKSLLGNRIGITNPARFGTVGVGQAASATSQGQYPFMGVSSASFSTNVGLPTTIGAGDLVKSGSLYGFVPHIVIANAAATF